jgi:hypothetical protein
LVLREGWSYCLSSFWVALFLMVKDNFADPKKRVRKPDAILLKKNVLFLCGIEAKWGHAPIIKRKTASIKKRFG